VSSEAPTVFVADDDPAARRALARLLRSASYQSETFASAEGFLARSHFDAPGCILLDLLNGRTPGLNGLELQQALDTADRQLPIVFVTGHGDIPMSVQAMKAGAVDFLLKPFNELVTMVVRICIRAPGPRANMAADSRSSTCVRNIDDPQKPIPTGT